MPQHETRRPFSIDSRHLWSMFDKKKAKLKRKWYKYSSRQKQHTLPHTRLKNNCCSHWNLNKQEPICLHGYFFLCQRNKIKCNKYFTVTFKIEFHGAPYLVGFMCKAETNMIINISYFLFTITYFLYNSKL